MKSRSLNQAETTESERLIRIMIVEDHHVVRAGLITLLGMAPDLEVVAEAGDDVEAEEQFRIHSPDVILIDLRVCGRSGSEVIKNLRCKSEKTRFVVLTAHAGEEDVYRAIQAGARAYLLKGATHDELIETTASGRSYFPVEIAATLAKRLSGIFIAHCKPTLSLRCSWDWNKVHLRRHFARCSLV